MNRALPDAVSAWFSERGWVPHQHQLEMTEVDRQGRSALLVAPTGAGKTLAGFLPSICDLAGADHRGIHTLYISPLKALAVDVARNLTDPIRDMALDIRVETRTGDTPSARRQRQQLDPPQILMTTPEQLALMLSYPQAPALFGTLRRVVLDELHALVLSKRGDLLSLGLARLEKFCPDLKISALSATVAEPGILRQWIGLTKPEQDVAYVAGSSGAEPQVEILASGTRVPWAGHSALYAVPELMEIIKHTRTTLLFVNTRSQAEQLFQSLWQHNDAGLAIGLHHGSLDVGQRRKVEAAMVAGKLRVVVCTSTLDLGIDWGAVDLVVQVGAPKGSSRLLQRIGRANHRLDQPSRALLVPANRFEVLECEAARQAITDGAQDSTRPQPGGLDVLAQHVLGMACSAPFNIADFYEEVTRAWPYRDLDPERFRRVVDFVASGGYALRAYERFARLKKTADETWQIAHPQVVQQYRMNIGTIVEEPMLKVRLVRSRSHRSGATAGAIGRGGRILGEIEEYFISQLVPGDTFLFGGEVVALETVNENEVNVSRSNAQNPAIPAYNGGKFPLSTYLARRVRETLASPEGWSLLPDQVSEWLRLQQTCSAIPGNQSLLIETFPRAGKYFLVCYPFEGRLAHQTLGMLLTKRMERRRMKPLGFVASEYALAIWCATDIASMFKRDRRALPGLFDEDMLGDDLESWLDESSLMRRTFRNCALVSGLIRRRYPGQEKSGRQITMTSDLIYKVLYQYEPDHILIEATRRDASRGLLDIERLGGCLRRICQNMIHKDLDRISPLAVPVMLEIGKEPVFGEGRESVLAEAAEALLREAVGGD